MTKISNRKLNNISIQYLIALLLAGCLYILTCCPAILWQDGGLFVYRIWHNDLQGNLGIALGHPLYIIIGIAVKAIPIGDLAHRINLISAVFGAVTIANIFLLLKLLLKKTFPAAVGAITLAVSWTFWQNAVIAEVYTLYTAQLSLELLILFQYTRTKRISYLYLLGLFNGLAISNHLLAVLPLACYGIFIITLLFAKQIKLKNLGVFILVWIVGAASYEYLIIKEIFTTGDISGTICSALFGNMWQHSVLNVSMSLKIVAENIVFILLNFPTPNFLLLFVGLWVLLKRTSNRSFANILLAMSGLFLAFAFRYKVPDRHAFFLPFYFSAAIIIGAGTDSFIKRFDKRAIVIVILVLAFLPIPAYFLTPEIARKYYKPLGQRRQRPYRDEYTYWLRPWKTGYRGAERFAREALDSVEKNAIIYAFTTDVHTLLYQQQVKAIRPDVKIISEYDSSQNAPVLNESTASYLVDNFDFYVISDRKGYCPGYLLENYDFVKEGVLYRVVGKTGEI